MAKALPAKTATKKTDEDKDKILSPAEQARSFLTANKADHYNFEETVDYFNRSSSLLLTAAMEGGLTPGAHRALGVASGGKTSCGLDFLYHHLKGGKDRRAVYIKCEGRLSKPTIARSGVPFVTNPDEWDNTNCFLFESNVYEAVFGFIGDLIRNNPTKQRYFFIIDSMDMMGKRDDLAKPLEEAGQVAGGALLTSVFLKKTSVALAKRGHIIWFISQVRDTIKLNPYEKSNPKQGQSSGGHALEHAGDYVLDFLPRFTDDIIRVDPANKKSKIVGHYCRINIVKSNNEKNGVEVKYPIKYGRTEAKSVWVEREIADLLLMWELIEKSGSMYYVNAEIRAEVKAATSIEIPDIKGWDNVYQYLEDQPLVTAFLYDKFLALITKTT